MLCRNQELLPSFKGYMQVLLLSAPFEIVILTFVSFLPSAGYPGFSTAVNVIANVINIFMDYVYIHFFHMGVNGAAWATLTGYLCATLVVAFAILSHIAPQAAALYNIMEAAQLALSVTALRIFSLMFIPRNAVLVYYRYLKVIGLIRYSSLLSALDSFAAIVPIAWVMARLFGITGFWWAFPVTEALLVALILVCNRSYAAKSEGRLRSPLLVEEDEEAKPVLDVTISKESEDISSISMTLQRVCEENGFDKRDAMPCSRP